MTDKFPGVTPIRTKKDAVDWLEKAMATKAPDYIYPGHRDSFGEKVCVYQWEGRPDCLIGVALSLAGWTESMLYKLDGPETVSGSWRISEAYEVFPDFIPLLGKDAVVALHRAQLVQDQGGTWGEAVEAANSND